MGAGTVQIDGSHGEGGGQVIRTSVALSAITGLQVHIWNIRAGRVKPGLKAQHLAAVRAAAEICDAEVRGDSFGSTDLWFRPRHTVKPRSYRFEVGTAGSTVLVAETVFLPLAMADGDSDLIIVGGTHNDFAPSAHFFEHVFLKAMASAGVRTRFAVRRYGFVPGGMGEIELSITGGSALNGLDLAKRGRLKMASARLFVSEVLPQSICTRGNAEMARLSDLQPEVERVSSATPGAACDIACEFEAGFAGFVGLGKKGKPIEQVVADAALPYRALLKSSASVDEHLADQLVLPMAFAKGESRWVVPHVTEHLKTVVWVVRQFVDREMVVETREDGTGVVNVGSIPTLDLP